MRKDLPLHRAIVVIDVAAFTDPSRKVYHHSDVHTAIYQMVEQAFDESDMELEACQVEDRGDGMMILLPPEVSKNLLADRLPARLAAELKRHNATRSAEAAVRLRVALHAGEVLVKDNGVVSPAINLTFRIVDAEEAKQALNRSNDVLAIIASDLFYQEVIVADPGANPDRYRRISVDVKQTHTVAWMYLPDSPLVPDVLPRTELDNVRKLLIGLTEDDLPQLLTLLRSAAGPTTPTPDRLTDAWSAFQHLWAFNAAPDGFPPALEFVQLVSRQVDEPLRASLMDWLIGQARRLGLEAELRSRHGRPDPIANNEARLNLLIMVQPDGIDPDRFLLSFWRQDDPNEWPPPRGESVEVPLAELEYQVDKLIIGAERAWSAYAAAAALEFLLPRPLLGLPVHQWRRKQAGSRPLFLDYPVVVRSLDRMEATELHRVWRRRWATMNENPRSCNVYYYSQPDDDRNENRIDALLSSPEWTVMVLTGCPTAEPSAAFDEDQLTVALRSGIPALIWHPEVSSDGLREIVTWLVEGDGMIDLPARTMASRLAALTESSVPFDVALANDIVVLWDDPGRLVFLDHPEWGDRDGSG